MSSESDDHLAGRVGDPERGWKIIRIEDLFRFFRNPMGQQGDLKGSADLLAQARRGEDEGLVAVRL